MMSVRVLTPLDTAEPYLIRDPLRRRNQSAALGFLNTMPRPRDEAHAVAGRRWTIGEQQF